jgi:hypothetical protein
MKTRICDICEKEEEHIIFILDNRMKHLDSDNPRRYMQFCEECYQEIFFAISEKCLQMREKIILNKIERNEECQE